MRKTYLLLLIFASLLFSFYFSFAKKENLEIDLKENAVPPEVKKEIQPVKDILSQLPQPQVSLSPREKISGKRKIEIKIPSVPEFDIEKAEIYLRQPSSLNEIFVDSTKGKEFSVELDSEKIPNGEYFLFVKIISSLGEYKGPETLITIENKAEEKKEETKKISEEITPVLPKLREKEEEAEKIIDKTQVEIAEKAKEKISEIPQIKELPSPVELQIKPHLKELKEKIEKEVEGNKEKPKIEIVKKEKENIKKEIINKVTEMVTKKAEELSPKEKEKVEIAKIDLERKLEETLEKTEAKLKEIAKEKEKIYPQAFKDSDKDGLSDAQEIILGTNPFNPDTDQDGFLDGVEYKFGFDPKKPGPADKIVWQDPREKGKTSDEIGIKKVEIKEKKLVISGYGIPNSFVTIYVFSKPIVAIAKVNEQGNFEYVLDKDIGDGQHTVYIALNNNQGEIVKKSSPFVFAKTGDKILMISELQAQILPPPSQSLKRSFFVLTLGVISLALSIAFFIMSLAISKRRM
jgi:hypothetical protein